MWSQGGGGRYGHRVVGVGVVMGGGVGVVTGWWG